MKREVTVSLAAAAVLAGAACDRFDPYEGFGKGDDGLGPIDPVTFPAANLGNGGSRTLAGTGLFQETHAFVDGMEVGYFPYLYTATNIPDYLRIREDGKPNPRVPTTGAFVFDATGAPPDPVPAKQNCTAPAGYRYSEVRDEVHYDQQGSVFAALPVATYGMGVASSTSYVPVVAEWPVSSAGQPCQQFKSRNQTEKALGLMPSGRFLAWLIIDPAAPVYRWDEDPDKEIVDLKGAMRGVSLQKWGWFNRYLLAYLDGGYIPTMEESIMEGGAMKQLVRMRPQKLYYPRSPIVSTAADGTMTMAAGRRGAGYDVMEARRADGDYSPVCQVLTYDAGMPLTVAQLPKRAEDITAMYMASIMPAAVPYIFCLQVR